MDLTRYIHPNLYSGTGQSPIIDLEKKEMVVGLAPIEVVDQHAVTCDFERYFSDLAQMTVLRKKLKIPDFSYSAMFYQFPYDPSTVLPIIIWARRRYETRWWVNQQSVTLLIAIADPDTSENGGWAFYQYAKRQGKYDGFGCPAWWEFCQHGIRIPLNWELDITTHLQDNVIRCTSPDKRYGMCISRL